MITQRMIVKALPIFLAACVLGIPVFAGLRLPDPATSGYSGTRFYQGTQLDFAVYDMTISADSLKFNNAPGQGRYVYAYQLFNLNSSAISFLSLKRKDGGFVGSLESNLGSVKDETGIAPKNEFFDETNTLFTYQFEKGSLSIGKYSYFLTFRSDSAPVVGTFSFNPPKDSDQVITPEPATMSLLLLGAVSMLRKRKR